jgi:hypothetical protein
VVVAVVLVGVSVVVVVVVVLCILGRKRQQGSQVVMACAWTFNQHVCC